MDLRSGVSAVPPDAFAFATLPYHIGIIASAERPALVSKMYILEPAFVFMSNAERPDISQYTDVSCALEVCTVATWNPKPLV